VRPVAFGENGMKRTPPLSVTSILPLVAVAFVVALTLLPSPASAASDRPARIVRVDYVLALMDAGVDQKEIIRRIVEKNLAFDLEPDDIGRLREAGCGDPLIEVMTAEQESRPSSFEGGAYEPGYTSLSFSFGYPYYYYPYSPYYAYYPYYSHYGYAPYRYRAGFYSGYRHYYPSHSYNYRYAPHGGQSYRGAPHGGSPRTAPHGGGRPGSSPRGSHH